MPEYVPASLRLGRRAVLLGGLVALAAPTFGWAGPPVERFASAARLADGSFAVAIVSGDGAVERLIPLPDRGHDICVAPDRSRAVAFARRPGTFAVGFRLDARSEPQLFHAPEGRHFYGHGVFSADGRLLFTTENDIASGAGVIGVHDAAGFRRIGEFPSHGAGPHDLLLEPDGRTLIVANGGIETHPDGGGRTPLNLASMTSAIVRIDTADGACLADHRLGTDLRQLSLRHMASGADGAVWIAAQHQGPETERPPLLHRLTRDGDLVPVALPVALLPRLRNYLGSVAVSRDGSLVAVSAPKAGRVLLFDAGGRFLRADALPDACGLAPTEAGGTVLATGGDRLMKAGSGRATKASARLDFDNHLVPI